MSTYPSKKNDRQGNLSNNIKPLPVSNVVAPFSQNAEEAVAGSVLLTPEAYPHLASIIKANDFYITRIRVIWTAFEALYQRREAIDYLTVAEQLRQQGWLEEVGGTPYLTHLLNASPNPSSVEFYAGIVVKTSIRRLMLMLGDELKANALNETTDISTLLVDARERVDKLIMKDRPPSQKTLVEATTDTLDRIKQALKTGLPSYCSTGIRELDYLLGGGWYRDMLILLGGRPGHGKSAIINTLITHHIRRKHKVLWLSCEMQVDELIQRLISALSLTPLDNIRQANFGGNDGYNKMIGGLEDLSSAHQIEINFIAGLRVEQIESAITAFVAKHGGIDAVYVDGVYRMEVYDLSDPRRDDLEKNKTQKITRIVQGLKDLAVAKNVPIIATHQPRKSVEERRDKRPELGDLEFAGDQVADGVIYMYRDIVYNDEANPRDAEMIVRKMRSGQIGTVYLQSYLETMRFTVESRKEAPDRYR